MMKTTFYVLFAFGIFIASCEAAACKEENDCANAPSGLTQTIKGKKVCCMSGGMSLEMSTVNGVTTFSCTCYGGSSGSSPGAFGYLFGGFGDLVPGGSQGPGGRKPDPKRTKPKTRPSFKETPLGEFRQASLEEHNRLRALHGSPPLKLSDDLNEFAQQYAEHLVAINRMEHSDGILPSTGESIGENLATMSSSASIDFKGPEAVKMWYDEIKDYDYNSPGFSFDTGHFTQVVWKATTELGMGKARSSDGRTVFAVGSYRVAGNLLGTFAENVPPTLVSSG